MEIRVQDGEMVAQDRDGRKQLICAAAVTGFGKTGEEKTAHFVCALVSAFS